MSKALVAVRQRVARVALKALPIRGATLQAPAGLVEIWSPFWWSSVFPLVSFERPNQGRPPPKKKAPTFWSVLKGKGEPTWYGHMRVTTRTCKKIMVDSPFPFFPIATGDWNLILLRLPGAIPNHSGASGFSWTCDVSEISGTILKSTPRRPVATRLALLPGANLASEGATLQVLTEMRVCQPKTQGRTLKSCRRS